MIQAQDTPAQRPRRQPARPKAPRSALAGLLRAVLLAAVLFVVLGFGLQSVFPLALATAQMEPLIDDEVAPGSDL